MGALLDPLGSELLMSQQPDSGPQSPHVSGMKSQNQDTTQY